MIQRETTINLPSDELYGSSPETQYSAAIETAQQTYELSFRPDTVPKVGSIALIEVIQIDHQDNAPEDNTVKDMSEGIERESLQGRQGPEYNNKGEVHTTQEILARWHDWARGVGRMLDVAWDEGTVTEGTLQEWIALKGRVAAAHAENNPYKLVDLIVPLRTDVFAFTKKLGVSDKAGAAYKAATE